MDDLILLDEPLQLAPQGPSLPPWKVLIVDDEPEIHAVTRLVLGNFRFEGRPLQFISAHSAAEGRKALAEHSDIALILLDVVMETDQAGLDLVRWIRSELNNHTVRIVLRTGQPGHSAVQQVSTDYDINDYKEKTELTTHKLTVTVRVALRGYRDILAIEQARRGMQRVLAASAQIHSGQGASEFASALLAQLAGLIGIAGGALFVQVVPPGAERGCANDPLQVAATTGELNRFAAVQVADRTPALPAALRASLLAAHERKQHVFSPDHYVLRFSDSRGEESLLYVGDSLNLSPTDIQLVEQFCTQMSIALTDLQRNQALLAAQRSAG